MNILSSFLLLLAVLLQNNTPVQQAEARRVPEADTAKRFPAILLPQADGTQKPLRMDKLSIDIKVVGTLAVTTLEMRFYNDLDRILEGELNFPLGDGQTVSRFAMDVNGKLREGVVVEKAQGRQVFENIVRQNIDPGLLEMTRGNTFRSRVYPIPARGWKHILVSYEQELLRTGDGLVYTLPMQFPEAIDSFSFHAEVVNEDRQPDLSAGEFREAEFHRFDRSFRADYAATNFMANKQFSLLVPGTAETKVFVEEKNGFSYFSLTTLPPLAQLPQKHPSSVCLLWDASGSGQYRDIQRELAVLDGYFRILGSCTVELVPFSNTVEKSSRFTISGGNWSTLRSALEAIRFDGGTQLGALDLKRYRCDEFILCTDGISNFGAEDIALSSTPVLVLNSAQAAEHGLLRSIAQTTGGRYVNLAELTDEEATAAMTTQPFSFISAEFSDGGATEIYPSITTPVHNSFALAGKLLTNTVTLTLNFGVGNRILSSQTVVIDKAQHSVTTGMTPRIWAQKKLAELDMHYQRNKEAITALGREYSIVTRNTSLIVLDRLEDYVRYRIAPPENEPELRTAYLASARQEEQQTIQEQRNRLDYVAGLFDKRKEWWNRSFVVPPAAKKKIQSADRRAERDSLVVSDRRRLEENEAARSAPGVQAEEQALMGSVTGSWSAEYGNSLSDIAADGVASAPAPVESVQGAVARQSGVQVGGSGLNIRGGRTSETQVRIDGLDMNDQFAGGFGNPPNASYSDVSVQPEGKAEITLKGWDPKTPYMSTLKKATDAQLYETYLSLRETWSGNPGFFVDAANYFFERKKPEQALRILSNLAELDMENHRLLRVLGNRLLQLGHTQLAVAVFNHVLKIREEEPQSYRDLALALAADRQEQRAVDTLYSLVRKTWDNRFPEVELIALNEMNRIIAQAGNRVSVAGIDPRLLLPMPVDVRVVLSWDADDCDVDLWITDPRGEKCYYQNRDTRIGGHLSHDLTGGYGPEEFLLKKALNGTYKVQANYYGDRQQRLAGPTTLQLTLYTNYGRPNEEKKDITLRVDTVREVVEIGEFEFAETKVKAVSK